MPDKNSEDSARIPHQLSDYRLLKNPTAYRALNEERTSRKQFTVGPHSEEERDMRYKGIAMLGLIAASAAGQGQPVKDQALKVRRSRVELRSFAGRSLPQGEQRRDFQ